MCDPIFSPRREPTPIPPTPEAQLPGVIDVRGDFTCFWCELMPAVPIANLDGKSRYRIFCSKDCAADYALSVLGVGALEWCDACGVWTDEDGRCPSCTHVRWKPLAELSRKHVEGGEA